MIHSKNQQRACDSCALRRARWYCAADDAFLCQNCDSSVHSANPLARRHHRVRLHASSAAAKQTNPDQPGPAWHHGFKRKARTPRPSPKVKARVGSGQSLVPELETSAEEEEEEQLLYRVPIFDPVLAEFCSPPGEPSEETKLTLQLEDSSNCKQSSSCGDCFAGFLQSDAELAEFAAGMESLLGQGMNDSFSIEELGLVDAKEQEVKEEYENEVKEEYENETNTTGDDGKIYEEIDFTGEAMEINFDCRLSDDAQEEMMRDGGGDEGQQGKKIGLRLDYEAISEQWSVNGCLSPWMNGQRPQFGPNDCWLDFMGMWGVGEVQVQVPVHGETGGVHMDEGREARVSRYREKRRTRLFSKKIRYEVRKLNAEKRPRMKGRFVKRSSFTAANNGTGFSY